MTDEQRQWNEQRQAMIDECRREINIQKQVISEKLEDIIEARKSGDGDEIEVADMELEEAQATLDELREELERLEDSVR